MGIKETSDIRLYSDGEWKTLIHSSIWDNDKWNEFGAGSGVYCDGDWWVLNEDIDSMILEYTVSAGDEIKLPFWGPLVDVYVDWGDSITKGVNSWEHFEYSLPYKEEYDILIPIADEEHITSTWPTHKYRYAGTYNVKIRGTIDRIASHLVTNPFDLRLVSIKQFGKIDKLTSISFENSRNLSGHIPADTCACFSNVTSFNSFIQNCPKITSISEDVFYYAKNVSTVSEAFSGLNIITIPEGIFRNCISLTNVEYCFAQSINITELPNNLFNNNVNVTEFGGIASGCFDGCSGLMSIPEDLFSNCVKAINFGTCFRNCTSLIEIPEKLFANNPKVTSFYYTFYGCTKLTHIPNKLFDNNNNVIDFTATFNNCINVQGDTPFTVNNNVRIYLYNRAGLIGYPASITGQACFRNCTKLATYDDIPSTWK